MRIVSKVSLQLYLVFIVCNVLQILNEKSNILNANEISVVSSYRDAGVIEKYTKEAEELTAIAKKLGYSIPKQHLLTFVSSGEMAQLASLGRYALPHWYDGAQIFSGMKQPSGVLEFVTKGEPASKSFYSDTTKFEHQISVIMHVLGHNDFALNSGFAKSTESYTTPASMELYEAINKLYNEVDHDEVSQFVQWLYSIELLQDVVGGSYQYPEDFLLKSFSNDELREFKTQAIKSKNKSTKPHQNLVNTPSVLSATVHNISPQCPKWKKEILSLFEKMVRHYPGNIQTKIINEGWATFSQFLIAKHSHWDNQEDAFIEFSGLLEAVTYPNLSNPYWLGLECWKNLYKNFTRSHSYLQSELELDQAFVKKAHEIMAWESSYDFIRSSLDEKWIKDKQLILYREATPEELRNYPGPQMEEGLMVVSRNTERIINAIARKNADMSLMFPHIYVKSLNENGTGGILLKHRVVDGVMLEIWPTIQALYVYALITEKPISLETIIYLQLDNNPENDHIEDFTMRVDPSGKVEIDLEHESSAEILKYLQSAVSEYEMDLQQSESNDLFASRTEKFHKSIKDSLLNKILTPVCNCSAHQQNGMISHSPTTSHAILEYESKMTERFSHMLTNAVRGNIRVSKSKNGVKFRVLPIVPSIQLSQRFIKNLRDRAAPAPIDTRLTGLDSSYQFSQDDNASIGSHKSASPGDILPKPKNEDGQGDESQESDESNEPDDSDEAGEDGSSPEEVEISLSDWGKALQEEIKLPNIRRTDDGENTSSKLKQRGTMKRDHGEIVYRRTLPAAILYPISEDIFKNDEVNLDNVVDKVISGIPSLNPSDYRVKSRKEVPKPNYKAVVVIVMDLSGSMQGKAHQMAANLVFNFKALLLSQYDDIEFRYVVYDTQASEFTEDDVFGKNPKFLGGGTSNVAGYNKAEEILNEYSYESWNKYMLGIGDAGNNDGTETVKILERIYPDLQHFSFVYTNAGVWADRQFLNAIFDFTEKNKWASYGELNDPSQSSIFSVLKKLFSY